MLFALLSATVGFAQQSTGIGRGPAGTAPALPAETKPEDLCAIEGKVVNVATGEPVRKANVTMRRTDMAPGAYPSSYTTATDEAGKYGMKDIEPGKYRLSVSRTGFVQMEYGARRPSRQGTTLTLSAGQRVPSVDFKLTPHGVIAGRVVDADGEPLAWVQISTMSWRYTQRGRQLTPGGGASTNDLGEFRIFGLAPGRYYLRATHRASFNFDGALDRSARDAPEEGHVPTYFPGTTDPASAAPVEVTPGAQLMGIDIRLSKARTVRLRGRINIAQGAGRTPAMVMLLPRDSMFYGGENRAVAAGPEARFEFRGLVPGSYTLSAVIPDGSSTMSAQQPIEIGNTNIDNVVLSITSGQTLPGDLTVEGAAPGAVNLADVRVSLRPRDQFAPMYGPPPNDRVQPDGTFTLRNVPADTLHVFVTGLPEGHYLKSARLGDQDAIDNGINVASGAGSALRLVIAAGVAQLDGSVSNDKQEPTPGVTVVALPANEKRRYLFQQVKTATTDQYGRFSLKNLDPGDYELFAWEDVESGTWMDPDFRKPAESKAKKVTLREGARDSVELKVTPAPE